MPGFRVTVRLSPYVLPYMLILGSFFLLVQLDDSPYSQTGCYGREKSDKNK